MDHDAIICFVIALQVQIKMFTSRAFAAQKYPSYNVDVIYL